MTPDGPPVRASISLPDAAWALGMSQLFQLHLASPDCDVRPAPPRSQIRGESFVDTRRNANSPLSANIQIDLIANADRGCCRGKKLNTCVTAVSLGKHMPTTVRARSAKESSATPMAKAATSLSPRRNPEADNRSSLQGFCRCRHCLNNYVLVGASLCRSCESWRLAIGHSSMLRLLHAAIRLHHI